MDLRNAILLFYYNVNFFSIFSFFFFFLFGYIILLLFCNCIESYIYYLFFPKHKFYSYRKYYIWRI